MSKVEQLQRFIANSHCMDQVDGLRDYHAAAAIRNACRCHAVEIRIARIKRALNPYRVTVALAIDEDLNERIRLTNRVTGKTILL